MISKKTLVGRMGLFLLDILVFVLALYVSVWTLYGISLRCFVEQNFYFIILLGIIVVLNFYFFDLYYTLKDFRRFRQAVNLFLALLVSFFISTAIVFFDNSIVMGRKYLAVFFFIMMLGTVLNRIIFSRLTRAVVVKRAIIVGLNSSAIGLAGRIKDLSADSRATGIEVVGYVSCEGSEKGETETVRCIGKAEDIEKILEEEKISLIIYAQKKGISCGLNESLVSAKLKGIDLISVTALFSAITGQMPYEDINEEWLIEECLRGGKFSEIRMKRVVDIVLGSILLIGIIPLILVLAILIKLDSRGSVFFIQERIGRLGKTFKIFKLRTMAEAPILSGQEPDGWYKKNEHRITRVGNFLRRTHLDEIPQFFNVVMGDMSLVGPRPEMAMFIKQCEGSIPFYRLRLMVRPGITGWAQVWYSHTSTLKGYRKKFRYDLFYLANLSFKLDLEIMARTILRLMGYPREKGSMEDS